MTTSTSWARAERGRVEACDGRPCKHVGGRARAGPAGHRWAAAWAEPGTGVGVPAVALRPPYGREGACESEWRIAPRQNGIAQVGKWRTARPSVWGEWFLDRMSPCCSACNTNAAASSNATASPQPRPRACHPRRPALPFPPPGSHSRWLRGSVTKVRAGPASGAWTGRPEGVSALTPGRPGAPPTPVRGGRERLVRWRLTGRAAPSGG